MDHSKKYFYLKHADKNAFEIVGDMVPNQKNCLIVIKKIKEIFPHLSLTEAKEIVVIATSDYKSLHDNQGSSILDLE